MRINTLNIDTIDTTISSRFERESLDRFLEKAKKFTSSLTFYEQHVHDSGDITPCHLAYSTGSGRYDHTEVLYGILNTPSECLDVLFGVWEDNDNEDVIIELPNEEVKIKFEALSNDEIIGFEWNANYHCYSPYCKGEVTTIILPNGKRVVA